MGSYEVDARLSFSSSQLLKFPHQTMPLTFIDIERQKNWRIGLFFLPLLVIYFGVAALFAAFAHAVGAWQAARLPYVRMLQFWSDAASGKVEDPSKAPPLQTLALSGRCFVAGVCILGVGLLLREAVLHG